MAELIGRLRPGSRPRPRPSRRRVVGGAGGPAGGGRSRLGAHLLDPGHLRPRARGDGGRAVPVRPALGHRRRCSRSGCSRPVLRRCWALNRLRRERPAVARAVPGHRRHGRPGAAALPRAGPDPARVPGGGRRLRAGPADRAPRRAAAPRSTRSSPTSPASPGPRSASASAPRCGTARCGGSLLVRPGAHRRSTRSCSASCRCPPWDQAWIDATDFNSIGTGGRPPGAGLRHAEQPGHARGAARAIAAVLPHGAPAPQLGDRGAR